MVARNIEGGDLSSSWSTPREENIGAFALAQRFRLYLHEYYTRERSVVSKHTLKTVNYRQMCQNRVGNRVF